LNHSDPGSAGRQEIRRSEEVQIDADAHLGDLRVRFTDLLSRVPGEACRSSDDLMVGEAKRGPRRCVSRATDKSAFLLIAVLDADLERLP